MLVLSRKFSESVVVGDNLVRITVLEIKGNVVKLGFEAERSVPIVRSEIVDKDVAVSQPA